MPGLNQIWAHHATWAGLSWILPFEGSLARTPKGRITTDHHNLRQATFMLPEYSPQTSAHDKGIILKNAATHIGNHQHFR